MSVVLPEPSMPVSYTHLSVQRDRARLFQLFEPRDGRHDFHTVVRGVRVAAGEFFFMAFAAKNAAPASTTGVAEA